MKPKNSNLNPSYSFENCSVSKGGATQSQYASKNQLAKASVGGARRSPEYTLESKKK